MDCPKCETVTLVEAEVKKNHVLIDYCPTCKGFWLDKGELEKVSAAAIKELSCPGDAEQTSYLCPACDELLVAFEYPQTLVTIDMCKSCQGLWIDAAELKEIEVVRGVLEKRGQLIEYDEVRGVKGAIIRFIENAIDYLQSC